MYAKTCMFHQWGIVKKSAFVKGRTEATAINKPYRSTVTEAEHKYNFYESLNLSENHSQKLPKRCAQNEGPFRDSNLVYSLILSYKRERTEKLICRSLKFITSDRLGFKGSVGKF